LPRPRGPADFLEHRAEVEVIAPVTRLHEPEDARQRRGVTSFENGITVERP